MMNFKGLPTDVEIRTITKDVEIRAVTKKQSHVEDIVRAYNLKMEERRSDCDEENEEEEDEDEDEDDEPDITVPIIEMTYEDSDEDTGKEDNKPEIKIKNSVNNFKIELNGDDERNL